MALFTSYRDLRAVAEHLRARSAGEENGGGYRLLTQQSGRSAARLLESYRRGTRTLLLATASFWEGVDLPGESLEVLVLTRLPFGVPTDPRFQARAERRAAEGENPFTDLYLPEAVLRFKQGFGRLIRRGTDRGIVAVLDPRLLGKGYGKAFAAALPLPLTRVEDGPALARCAARWWRAETPPPEGDP
jgi:ATP-dependent DNA helicase DinG